MVAGRPAKAAHEVRSGEELSVHFRDRRNRYRVLDLPAGNIRKEEREKFVQLLHEELFHAE